METMGANIWTRAVDFGGPLGVSGNRVVAYSSEYRRADPSRFGDDSYESSVEIEVALHRLPDVTDVDAADDSRAAGADAAPQYRLSLRHHHKVSEADPDHAAIRTAPVAHPRHHDGPHLKDTSSVLLTKKISVYAGAKFQCVEYARRYLIMTHNISFPSIPMAYHILLAMPNFTKLHFAVEEQRGGGTRPPRIVAEGHSEPAVKSINASLSKEEQQLVSGRIMNADGDTNDHWYEGQHAPVPGSLLIWSPKDYFKHTGHVAAVVAVDDDRIYISEQNVTDCVWPTDRPYARSFPLQRTRIPVKGGGEKTVYGLNESYVNGVIWGWVTPKSLLSQ
jgi:hypothetical protein